MSELSDTAEAPAAVERKVEIVRRGALYNVHLNRPRALNAFDDDMRKALAEEIPRIARNADIYIVVLTSGSPRAFCAGGDIRALAGIARVDLARAKRCFVAEYELDWLLECFSKPSVSLINGICMGSGAGLTCPNTHRVAGEGYAWGMPETAIGLFPDVGVAHTLARMPWPLGLYLGLTGRSVERADAHWLGLATHCIQAAHFETILSKLAEAEPVDPLLDDMHETQPQGPLQSELELIRDYFSGATFGQIIAKLTSPSAAAKNWAEKTLGDLRRRSPMSLLITDRHIRSARSLDLRQTLVQDYRLACRCLEAPDFAEGVRAALIDKDNAPKWSPAKWEYVSDAEVARYFSPLSEPELVLPTREEMQAARV